MTCDRCNGETKSKTITGKDGRSHSGFECLMGCKNPRNPKYAYFFFPPRHNSTPQSAGQPQPNDDRPSGGETLASLKEIAQTLKRIETILANPGRVHVTQEEMAPSEETPF